MVVNCQTPKNSLQIADGLTNVVVYDRCTAIWCFSSRAAFSVTFVGISLLPLTDKVHTYVHLMY